MLTKVIPSGIVGVPITFNPKEVESFFVEQKRLPKGAGKRRKFSLMRLKQKLAERVVWTILDYHHDALALRPRQAQELYRRVEVLPPFSMSHESRKHAGQYEIRIEYRIAGEVGRWRHVFHFVLDDVSSTGGLDGKLYTSSRRSYAK